MRNHKSVETRLKKKKKRITVNMPGHKAALGLTIIVAYSFMLSSSPELCGVASVPQFLSLMEIPRDRVGK